MRDPNCSFCQKVASLDALCQDELIWEFPQSVALLGPWQYFHGYALLVSRSHQRELFALTDEARRAYLDEMCLLARAIDQAFSPLKMNYELLGNQVPHLHWHLFPRYADDPERLAPVWLILREAECDDEQRRVLQTGRTSRAEIISRLKQTLTSLGASTA